MEHELDLGFQKYENKKMSIPELVHSDLLAKNSKKYKINNIHKQANGFWPNMCQTDAFIKFSV